jgi:competence protein ComEC
MRRPLLHCAVFFCAGLALAGYFPAALSAAAAFFFILLAALSGKRKILPHIALYLALFFFGCAYITSYNALPADHVASFASDAGNPVTVTGTIADDPVRKNALFGKKKVSFTLAVSSVGDRAARGLVKTDIFTDSADDGLRFADKVSVSGTLSAPRPFRNRGIFDYSRYLRQRNIYTLLDANGAHSFLIIARDCANGVELGAHAFRTAVNAAIDRYVDNRYSAFLKAILVGERSSLDSSVTDDFVKTGTVHVIAISGLNIALIAGIFLAIFGVCGVRKKINLAITSAAIVFYCVAAGANPPVVRATVMFVMASLAYILERDADILNSLGAAAIFILLANPNELYGPSFQLSFASIIGIAALAPRIEAVFAPRANFLVKGIAVSAAAMAAVWPLVAKYFNIISPVALAANLVIVPALFVITAVSLVFMFFNMIGFDIALVCLGGLLSLLTQATFYVNRLFAAIPFAYFRTAAPSLPFIAFYYAALCAFVCLKRKKEVILCALIAANIFVWKDSGPARAPRELRMTFIDVGAGDSTLIEFPNRMTMLIDAGFGGIEGFADTARLVVAPVLWNKGIRRLDAVVCTHFHADHAGGMIYIIDNFGIGCAMDAGSPATSDAHIYNRYRKAVNARSVRRLKIYAGDEITGFGEARLYVLNPPEDTESRDANEDSIALKLVYADFSALMCGDISSGAMTAMSSYADLLKSDLIKIPHHGGSVGDEQAAAYFLKEVSPKAAVISSSRQRAQGQKDIYSGFPVFTTKNDGALEAVTDGKTFSIIKN